MGQGSRKNRNGKPQSWVSRQIFQARSALPLEPSESTCTLTVIPATRDLNTDWVNSRPFTSGHCAVQAVASDGLWRWLHRCSRVLSPAATERPDICPALGVPVAQDVIGRTTGQRGVESCGLNTWFDPIAEQFRDRPGVIRHPCGHPRRSIHPPTIHLYAK